MTLSPGLYLQKRGARHHDNIKKRKKRLPVTHVCVLGEGIIEMVTINHLTLRLLMSYIYGAPILDVSRSHTTTQHIR